MPGSYIVRSIEYHMDYIEPGKFIKGSPVDLIRQSGLRYSHDLQENEISISKGFYMGSVVVAQHHWLSVMGTSPWETHNVKERSEYPAVWISWNDCQEFIKKLNENEQSDKYRLPTDAEWEYACRAGSQDIYFFGNDKSLLRYYAWTDEDYREKARWYPFEVAMRRPNAWGLFDMLGNVEEWCQDWYHFDSSDETNIFDESPIDPKGPPYGRHRIKRGGGYKSASEEVYCAMRDFADPRKTNSFIGFRLVKDL